MNHNAGIQFFGIDSVVTAYVNKQCPVFSLWAGKNMLLKYDGTGPDGFREPSIDEGMQLLNDYLNAMYQGTTAIYTLRTYDDLKKGDKIKPSTEYDTAFNFKINVQGQGNEMGVVTYSGGRGGALMEELKKIRADIDELKNDSQPDDEPRDIIGTVNHLLEEPDKLREVVDSIAVLGDVFKGLFGIPVQPRAAMGNLPFNRVSDISSEVGEPVEQKLRRLQTALDELERHDSKIVDHLEKLSTIARDNPAKFRSLIAMLEIF